MTTDLTPLNQIIKKWHDRKDFLIEILQDIQDKYNYLPANVLMELSKIMVIPLNQIYEAATYYKTFSLEPKGRHQINVCQGTACHIQGAAVILKALERELNIKVGETDKHLDFTLDTVRCIGCCGLAPVLTIGEDVHAKFNPSQVPRTIEKYRKMLGKRPQEKQDESSS